MKRKSLKELKEILDNKNKILLENIEMFAGDKNSQVKEIYNRSCIEKELIDDILKYINSGNTINLK